MVKIPRASLEVAQYWEQLADQSQPEVIPAGLSPFDDFEYLVVSNQLMPNFPFGGYDTFDTETGATETLMIVNEFVEQKARPLLVAHMLLHKLAEDDGTPHLCAQHDKLLQSNIAAADPSLILPFYEEATQMYAGGYRQLQADPRANRLLVDRYSKALKNTQSRGELATISDEVRKKLTDLGLELPDGDVALNAVDKRTGTRTNISLQTERSNRHKCKNCSHSIPKSTSRITISSTQKINGYDHHHFHPGCFTHIELGIFGDIHQMPHEDTLPKH